jgi:cytochrome c oxidase cbb3-type subunit 4
MNTINGLLTGLLLIIFLGIWLWAWSSRNKEKFDAMSKLPLEEESNDIGGKSHE